MHQERLHPCVHPSHHLHGTKPLHRHKHQVNARNGMSVIVWSNCHISSPSWFDQKRRHFLSPSPPDQTYNISSPSSTDEKYHILQRLRLTKISYLVLLWIFKPRPPQFVAPNSAEPPRPSSLTVWLLARIILVSSLHCFGPSLPETNHNITSSAASPRESSLTVWLLEGIALVTSSHYCRSSIPATIVTLSRVSSTYNA